jgi:abhydrolase domain-containing protein 6
MHRAITKDFHPLIVRTPEEFRSMLALLTARPIAMSNLFFDYLTQTRIARADDYKLLYAGWMDEGEEGQGPAAKHPIGVPTLVVHGDTDRVIDVSTTESLARVIPQAQVVIYRDTGHLPQIERPGRLARDLMAFVAKHG